MAEDTEFISQGSGEATNPFGTTALSTTGETGTSAATLKDQAVDTGQKVLSQTKEAAGQAIERAKVQMKSQLADQKGRAVDSLSGAVRVLESTGQQFRSEDLSLVGNYAESFSQQIRRASDYLSEKNVDDIARDVEDFARKNPSLFIGGAFVLGVALSRFLKSSQFSTPLGAFSTDKASLAPANRPAIGSPMTTPMNSPITSPMANTSSDVLGQRPMSAHNYVPGVGVTGTDNEA
jgi:hypothetical protein